MEWFVLFVALVFVSFAISSAEKNKRIKREFRYAPEPILGNASYATDRDCKRAGLFSRTGIPCGYAPESGRPLRYDGDAMMITVAPVGSGKGTSQIIPACLSLDDRSLLVFCPKGETPAVVAAHRAKLGPCFTLAPYGGVFPGTGGMVGARHNPMDILNDPREPRANFSPNARSIAEGTIFRETQNAEGEFFSSAAVNAVHGVTMGVARYEPPEKRNLIRAAEIFSTDEIFDWSRWIVRTTSDPFLKQSLGLLSTAQPEDRTVQGVLSTVRTNLHFLGEQAMADCLCASDFSYSALRERVSTVFVTVPVDRMDVGGRFFGLNLNIAMNRLLAPGRAKKRVVVICDEFFAYGTLPAIESAVGVSRAFGVQIWPILQDLSQLEMRYPRSHQTFLSNAGVRVFMTPQDQKTASYVSEQIGITQVSTWQKSVNFDQQNEPKPGWTRPPSARPLEHPHEVRACPEDRMYVFVRGVANVIKARRIPYFRRSEFRGKYRDNPYYKKSGGIFSRIFG